MYFYAISLRLLPMLYHGHFLIPRTYHGRVVLLLPLISCSCCMETLPFDHCWNIGVKLTPFQAANPTVEAPELQHHASIGEPIYSKRSQYCHSLAGRCLFVESLLYAKRRTQGPVKVLVVSRDWFLRASMLDSERQNPLGTCDFLASEI